MSYLGNTPHVYAWSDGSRQSGNAQAVGEELERIRLLHNGALTPEDTVAEARSTASPLHPHFTWDVTAGFEKNLLTEARALIRAVVVVPEPEMGAGAAPVVRAFVVVGPEKTKAYTSTYTAMSDAQMREEVLQKALRELRQWRQRYRDFVELADIFRAIDDNNGQAA